ncbi:MAG: hypothetical protein U9Q12_02035 [Patescibacteria group bacterium]|nr:hypothetical protein [Patescibacteria group bacterium]
MDIESKYSLKHQRRVKKIKNKRQFGDIVPVKKPKLNRPQISELNTVIKHNHQNNTQTLLLKGGRTDFFVTEDSRKYTLSKQQYKKDHSHNRVDSRGHFDSVHVRYTKTHSAGKVQQEHIVSEFENTKNIATSFRMALKLDMSPIRMWQVSLAGAVLFGMVSMSMIYKNLGQSAFAKGVEEAVSGTNDKVAGLIVEENQSEDSEKEVEKKSDIKKEKEEIIDKKDIEAEKESVRATENKKEEKIAVDSIQKKDVPVNTKNDDEAEEQEKTTDVKSMDSVTKKDAKSDEKKVENTDSEYSLEREAYELVKGYPIEKMLPHILKLDPEVAKFYIAIAKQESAWGKRVPVLNGQDCYNYVGYRSQRKLMGSGGHTCFNSRKDAVETVGKRIHELIYEYDRATAESLVVWKCGSSCATHSPESVNRWINVIDTYHKKLSPNSK